MYNLGATSVSCGVMTLYSLYPDYPDVVPQDALRALFQNLYMKPGMVIVFSDAEFNGRGRRFAKWIEREKLGDLVFMDSRNPNSGNLIRTWLWKYNGDKPKDYNVYTVENF